MVGGRNGNKEKWDSREKAQTQDPVGRINPVQQVCAEHILIAVIANTQVVLTSLKSPEFH